MVNLPVLLTYKGVKFDKKIAPVVKAQNLTDNNNNRGYNEQKKRNVQTTAAILRISKQGQSKARTN
jgi:predicted DNA-binding WGR domain protein